MISVSALQKAQTLLWKQAHNAHRSAVRKMDAHPVVRESHEGPNPSRSDSEQEEDRTFAPGDKG